MFARTMKDVIRSEWRLVTDFFPPCDSTLCGYELKKENISLFLFPLYFLYNLSIFRSHFFTSLSLLRPFCFPSYLFPLLSFILSHHSLTLPLFSITHTHAHAHTHTHTRALIPPPLTPTLGSFLPWLYPIYYILLLGTRQMEV